MSNNIKYKSDVKKRNTKQTQTQTKSFFDAFQLTNLHKYTCLFLLFAEDPFENRKKVIVCVQTLSVAVCEYFQQIEINRSLAVKWAIAEMRLRYTHTHIHININMNSDTKEIKK